MSRSANSKELGARSSEPVLPLEAFWDPPLGVSSRVAEALLDQGVSGDGLHLLAPSLVDLSARSTLPVLACLRGEAGSLLGPGDFAAHGVVHVIDPQTGHGGASLLSELGSRGVPGQGASDPFARVIRLDLRERFGLGWRSGQLLVTLLLFEKASRRALVELAFPARLAGADFETYLGSQRAKLLPNEGSLVPLAPDPHRPPPPAPPGGGIALSVDGMQRHVDGFPLRLRGAFDLPSDSVIPATSIPVRLLVLSTSETRMRENVLWVDVASSSDGRLRGAFMMDLGAMLPPPSTRSPERLFIYAFSGASFGGPVTTTRFDDTLVDSPLA